LKTNDVKTKCILAMDDDMLLDPKDIEFGYQTWKTFGGGRSRMVGFIPRVSNKDNTAYRIDGFKKYSMVLTKSAFFHTDWMDAYWSNDERMTRMRKYVDDKFNCEDILMSFLHAYHTRQTPLYVKPHRFKDTGLVHGVSTNKNHLKERAVCVRVFAEEFGNDTLVESSTVFTRMGD
jgi:alpha-1,4-N-acetylglucosaminyltransferase EXTL3